MVHTCISSADPNAIIRKRRNSGLTAAAGRTLRPDWHRSTLKRAAPRPSPGQALVGQRELLDPREFEACSVHFQRDPIGPPEHFKLLYPTDKARHSPPRF